MITKDQLLELIDDYAAVKATGRVRPTQTAVGLLRDAVDEVFKELGRKPEQKNED